MSRRDLSVIKTSNLTQRVQLSAQDWLSSSFTLDSWPGTTIDSG